MPAAVRVESNLKPQYSKKNCKVTLEDRGICFNGNLKPKKRSESRRNQLLKCFALVLLRLSRMLLGLVVRSVGMVGFRLRLISRLLVKLSISMLFVKRVKGARIV